MQDLLNSNMELAAAAWAPRRTVIQEEHEKGSLWNKGAMHGVWSQPLMYCGGIIDRASPEKGKGGKSWSPWFGRCIEDDALGGRVDSPE